MKRLHLFLVCACLCFFAPTIAQQTYTVSGESLTLKTEVSGSLTLLWNTIDGDYRYFSKKGSEIQELTNTKVGNDFQEEYKDVLRLQTGEPLSLDKVKLTLPSLKSYFEAYNQLQDPNYTPTTVDISLDTRLGGFIGGSNSIYYDNPDNTILPQFGVDFEIIDNIKLKRHSILFQFRQVLSSSDFDFSSSQFSLNYRFKFVQKETLDIFTNLKLTEYTNVSRNLGDVVIDDEEALPGDGGTIRAPLALGIGADIALGGGYLTIAYNDIVALTIDNNGEFPVDLTIGYKFNL